MRYAGLIILLFAACCAGCAHGAFGRDAIVTQYQRAGDPSPYAQGGGYYENPLRDRVAAGAGLGNIISHWGDAVDGYVSSEFEGGSLVGANILFMLPMRGGSGMGYWAQVRHGLELRLENYDQLLTEDSFDFGKLNITSFTAAYKVLWMPPEDRVFGYHCDAGLGLGNTSFSKDPMLKQDDLLTGIETDIDPGTALIFSLGIGADFYFQPQFCLTLDYRIVFVDVPVTWSENDVVRSDIDFFNATNHQFIVGFRVHF